MPMLNINKKLTMLTEAKADTQKLIDFAGEELANRFLAVKHKIKPPRNDLYFWIKNRTPDQLLAVVQDAEATKSKRQMAREADLGAELICETDRWKVYHITTFEASQKYGRDTTWCITGVNSYGDRYWKQYTGQGVKFYFLITKGDYDPRGYDSKFAIAVYPNGEAEMYNQQDDRAGIDEVPCPNGIKIPGVNIDDIKTCIGFCEYCDIEFEYEDDINYGPNGEYMCESCYEEHCFTCSTCYETFWQDEYFELPDGDYVCERCFENADVGFCDGCGEVFYFDSLHAMDDGEFYCDDCYEEEPEEVDEELKSRRLTEAKADIENLVAFAGKDLADRFLAIKSRFKSPENDLYYWVKNKTVSELDAAVSRVETAKSNRQRARDVHSSGAELVSETPHWKIYRIDTYEAAQYYGRDTKWCITGINDWGDEYWLDYTNDGVKFYFLITKDKYDPRGLYSKIALAIFPDNKCEIYNQRDGLMLLDKIPFIDEVEIPGIDLNALEHTKHICHECNQGIKELETFLGLDNNEYCEACFQELFCVCDRCEDTFKIEDCDITASGHWMCYNCIEESDEEILEDFRSNWIDANGNKVTLSNIHNVTSNTVSNRTFTERFKDIIEYYRQHLPTTVTYFEVTDIIEDSVNALFYITEKHQIGKTWYERKVIAAVSKNKGQPEPWVIAVYKDKNLDHNDHGYGYDQLLSSLSKVIKLPKSGSAEFDKLRESIVNTFVEDFGVYDTLWK